MTDTGAPAMNNESNDRMLRDGASLATGADVVAAALSKSGVTHAFGIPGGEVLALVDALERRGITFVLARHENAAGFMAEGLWRTAGSIPVLVATLGPGVANAVNVVANAFQDRVPMVFLTGCVDTVVAQSFTHQVFDHQAVLRPIVKATFRLERGAEAVVMAKAIKVATSGRPGPVHIDVPVSVAQSLTSNQSLWAAPPADRSAPVDLDGARKMVARARRPLVLAGLDVANTRGAAAVERFLARTGAPLLTTYKAKGVVGEADDRVIGAVGLSPKADDIVRPLLEEADLIVLAGYDPIEMREGWRHPWPASKPVLDIVAQDVQHGMHHSSLLLEGDVPYILDELSAELELTSDWGGVPAEVRSSMRKAFVAGSDWGPHAIFETLQACAPSDALVTVDSGAHRILFSQMWSCSEPATMLQSTGLCTMGCALPLASGAALGARRPTICVIGDGCLEMSLGELATLRDLDMPVVIVVLVDGSLNLIAMKQQRQGMARVGVDFGISDFAAIARAMGGYGADIDDRASLEREAVAAFERRSFTLLACRISRESYDGAF